MQLKDIPEYDSLAIGQIQLNNDINAHIENAVVANLTVGLIRFIQSEVERIENEFPSVRFFHAEYALLFHQRVKLVKDGLIDYNRNNDAELVTNYIDYKVLFIAGVK